jgi:hypothetical protein
MRRPDDNLDCRSLPHQDSFARLRKLETDTP